MLRNQAQYERQVEKLKSEVLEMKRNKVKLVQKMKETDKRHREMETQRTREMSTLKKIGRKNESKIKSLEAEKRMKELALKRKSEEVSLLRKAQRRVSQMRPNSKKVYYTVGSEGFLYKVAPPELKISPNVYFIMYNSVVLPIIVP